MKYFKILNLWIFLKNLKLLKYFKFLKFWIFCQYLKSFSAKSDLLTNFFPYFPSILVPWDRVTVDVISIHLVHFSHKIDYGLYTGELIKYLEDLSYQLVWNHDKNFVFRKIAPVAVWTTWTGRRRILIYTKYLIYKISDF